MTPTLTACQDKLATMLIQEAVPSTTKSALPELIEAIIRNVASLSDSDCEEAIEIELA